MVYCTPIPEWLKGFSALTSLNEMSVSASTAPSPALLILKSVIIPQSI